MKQLIFMTRRFSLFSVSGMVILILMLSICAVAPFPSTVGELPFTDEEIGFIKPGLTSRGQVEAALGQWRGRFGISQRDHFAGSLFPVVRGCDPIDKLLV